VITAADTAATRERLLALRAEIAGGASFEDVARRESADSASGVNGGDLGRGARGRFVPEFENAAFRLRAGELSQPVLTDFGYHLIKVDERKGDTIAVRHILLTIQQSDSAATATDRRADELATMAAGSEEPAKFDSAASQLGLQVYHVEATENRPAALGATLVPSISAWAFSGARPGESSELFDDENGYWLARLDSAVHGGEPDFARVRQEVREAVAMNRKLDSLMVVADRFAKAAAGRAGGLEAAAREAGLEVVKTPAFNRLGFVPGLGRFTEPIGAAFGLPVGAVSAPVRADNGVYVLRVDRRVNASREEFEKQRDALRRAAIQQQRQNRVQLFLDDLRRSADIADHRKDINATIRRTEIP
jgi:peptidyl-prolyl cis-trans isomerase D